MRVWFCENEESMFRLANFCILLAASEIITWNRTLPSCSSWFAGVGSCLHVIFLPMIAKSSCYLLVYALGRSVMCDHVAVAVPVPFPRCQKGGKDSNSFFGNRVVLVLAWLVFLCSCAVSSRTQAQKALSTRLQQHPDDLVRWSRCEYEVSAE